MKPLAIISLLFLNSSLFASAALPVKWDVELTAQPPQVFTLQRPHGETYELEAVLKNRGKPFEPAITNACIYWQTNGMENLYWSAPASVSNNFIRASWLPSMDPGATTVRGYIGDPGHIYAAAFQFRFISSPGVTPNELPLPQKVIDFAKVTVLNPPWSGGGGSGGVDTNAVELIANMAVETNAVTVGLSSSVSNRYTKAETDAKFAEKRYKSDRAVYSVIRTENTDWMWTSPDDDGYLLNFLRGKKITFNGSEWNYPDLPTGYADDIAPYGSPDDLSVSFQIHRLSDDFYVDVTATRPRYMDETLGPEKQNQQLAAVATDDASKPADASIMKYDAANDRFVKAIEGTDYLKTHQDVSGKFDATHDFDGENASLSWEAFYLGVRAPYGLYVLRGGVSADEYDQHGHYVRIHSLFQKADRATTLSGYGITDGATKTEVNAAMTAANDANVWSSATFNFMTGGRTNCWFSGTNYVFGTDAAARMRFAWEDGMDAATVPCSMALWEIRDGVRQLVWDQRDWTAWYWSFKANQMQTNVAAQIAALGLAVTNDSNYAWAKRYASDGTPNPDASTTFIDTPSVTLSPGMKWETVATVSGAAYWTIVGDGAIIGGSGTNAVLRIQDFEGNDIMTVTKGEHRLAWIERGEITGQMHDGDGWVCFDMLADVEPIGYFSTTLDSSDFLPQTDPNCPAQYEWEDLHNGKYRIHYLLKPGIQSNACFAKFQVEVEGQTIIRYNAGQEISGGLIYNGVKIAPDISGHPAVGTVIQWKVVNR